MKKIILSLLVISIFSVCSEAISKESFKVLSWWEYISPESIQEMNRRGFSTELIYYKSNESALARIGAKKDKFDIVIVSGINLGILKEKKLIRTEDILTSLKRDYHRAILNDVKNCLPYQWSSTVFMFNNLDDTSVHDIESLIKLKENGFSVGLVDDPNEIFSRIALDEGQSSAGGLSPDLFTAKYKNLSSGDFSSTVSLLEKRKSAVYGWSGEARDLVKKGVGIRFVLPAKKIIVGTDYACIAYSGNNPARLKRIQEFLVEFTNERNSSFNTAFNQYFSPYKTQVNELLPIYRNLLAEILAVINKGDFFIIPTPLENSLGNMFSTWRKVRFH